MESVQLTTDDGCVLQGDLAMSAIEAVGGVVVCHPHPSYGGDRFNPVVDAVFRALPPAGFAALRFDFRAEYGGGVAERADVAAAVSELANRTDAPISVVGYSFGAVVALTTEHSAITRIVAIAPPLAQMEHRAPGRPTLVLAPRHDQFTPPDEAQRRIADWPDVDLTVIESADHFLAGHAAEVTRRAIEWLTGPDARGR